MDKPRDSRVDNELVIAQRVQVLLDALRITDENICGIICRYVKYPRVFVCYSECLLKSHTDYGYDERVVTYALESLTRFYPNRFYEECAFIKRKVMKSTLKNKLRAKFIKDICRSLPLPIFEEIVPHIEGQRARMCIARMCIEDI